MGFIMTSDLTGLEQKKVQEVKGSFYIYLPKEWCTKYDIAASKKVLMKQLSDDSLLIRAEKETGSALDDSKLTINLDLDEKPNEHIPNELYENFLFNQYLTAYIIGVKTIIFKKRTNIPLQIRSRIRKMTQNFLGMAMISEKDTTIVVEDTTTQIDLRLTVRQILSKVGITITNLIEIMESSNVSEIPELINQDDQIDGHRYAIERQVHRILRYPTLALANKTNSMECLHYAETGKLVERVGDYVLQIAKLYLKKPFKDGQQIVPRLKKMYTTYTTVQDFFEREDSFKFFEITESVKKEKEELNDLMDSEHPYKSYFSYLRRIFGICGDISEIRINDILSRKYHD